MLKSAAATTLLIGPLDLLGIVLGDPHLLSTGNYRLLSFLWITHLLFWFLYLAAAVPIFLSFARRVRREPGDAILGSLIVGLLSLAYAFAMCVWYLHRDLGFFSPSRLPVNAAIFLGAMAAAWMIFTAMRPLSGAFERLGFLFPVLGLLLASGLWGVTWIESRVNDTTLTLDAMISTVRSETQAGADGQASGRTRHRVVLLGLDGADWLQIDPLVAQGRLPNFARLKSEGVTAPMKTISPFSPVDWTTIATGMDPGHHSVQYFSETYWPALDLTIQRLDYNFLEPLVSRAFPKGPVSSTTRTSKALWEIAGAFDRRSLVINWWATFPAEPQQGVMISNYAIPWDEISPDSVAKLTTNAHRVYPEDLWPQVHAVLEKEVAGGLVTRSGTDTDPNTRITVTEFWDARDRIALDLYRKLENADYDLSLLYLQTLDTTSHHLSETAFGRNADIPRESRVPPEVMAEKREKLASAYEWMDSLVGELAGALRDGDLLVVVSDHGWRYDGTSHWRFPDGIFALYGPAVRTGWSPGKVSIYDVAPTILYYLGLPVSRQMPGRFLEEAFKPEVISLLPKVMVASYGNRARPMRVNDPDADSDYRSKLKSLGYVQ